MKDKQPRNWREKGMAVLITAAMLTFTIPIVGLAVDASLLYGIKARLSTAADAASLAAARTLAVGVTIADQEQNARATAQRFFDANFPQGYMFTTARNVVIDVAETQARVRTVTITADVTAPNYFLRYMGKDATVLRASGRASRRDINVVLVLDRSGSLQNSGSCTPMKQAAISFVNMFANFRDRIGLVTYGTDSRIDFPMQNPTGDFLSGAGGIPSLINQIICTAGTGSTAALWRGYTELVRINEPGTLNVILFFTDGQPNAVLQDYSAAGAIRTAPKYAGAIVPPGTYDAWTSRSGCASTANKVGVVQPFGSPNEGIFLAEAPPIPIPAGWQAALIADRAGCSFNLNQDNIHRDLAFLPDLDIYGNALNDGTYKSTSKWAAGHPDAGKIRPDNGGTLTNAAINSLNNAALRIRNNATAASQLNTVIYSLGLGGAGAAEDEILNRVANTPASPIYDNTKLSGLYVFAANAAELNQAFVAIASEILRIAQ